MHRHEFIIDGDQYDCSTEQTGKVYHVQVGERTFDILPIGSGLFSVVAEGRKLTVAATANKNMTYVGIDTTVLELCEPSEEGFAGGAGDQIGEKDKIYAPMPGKIVKLMVEVGDVVDIKQHVVIVEAMKMENPVLAKAKGTVKAINFAVGDQVDTDTPIVELELELELEKE